MILSLTGQLVAVNDTPASAHLQVGPITYELMIPAADVGSLGARTGTEITFHTLFYLEGTAGGGNLDPKLIGFTSANDKRFFNLFTTVKGIGPKTALRALSVPVGEIAQAIESKDTRALTQLDGIGKRTAELIVAELSGKARAFATADVGRAVAAYTAGGAKLTQNEEEALVGMAALGVPRPDAERLLDRVKQLKPDAKSTDALLTDMLRLRSAGK